MKDPTATARHSPKHSGTGPRIGLFGMAPDTGNMGVSALCKSSVAAIIGALPDCELVVFDNGYGIRQSTLRVGETDVPILLCGARGGRRYYRQENLYTMNWLSKLGALGRVHPVLRLIDSCTVIMDISAGDSFSDIYGNSRFDMVTLPKRIAAHRSRPLVLLPQTYGPFADRNIEDRAREAVFDSDVAWARDDDSFQVLKNLLGADFNPERHRSGVDMAFGLPACLPAAETLGALPEWLEGPGELIGFNVSGLVWNSGSEAARQFGFKADYRELVRQAIDRVLADDNVRLLLIPHVMAPSGSVESDADAAAQVLELIDQQAVSEDRIRIAPSTLDEQELKWLIARCDWFCGTRMHATIAGLSSGVPTASIVYSDKAAGVFAKCHQRDQIIDPRKSGTQEALDRFTDCYRNRHTTADSLASALGAVQDALAAQTKSFTDIVRLYA